MMTQADFLRFSLDFHTKCHKTTTVKNVDYSPGENPFSNFEKLQKKFGQDWPLKLLISRMHEKLDRITNYAIKGKNKKNSEPLDNDFQDLANYSCLTLAYLKSKHFSPRKPKSSQKGNAGKRKLRKA
jgi:hypothetical protein